MRKESKKAWESSRIFELQTFELTWWWMICRHANGIWWHPIIRLDALMAASLPNLWSFGPFGAFSLKLWENRVSWCWCVSLPTLLLVFPSCSVGERLCVCVCICNNMSVVIEESCKAVHVGCFYFIHTLFTLYANKHIASFHIHMPNGLDIPSHLFVFYRVSQHPVNTLLWFTLLEISQKHCMEIILDLIWN